MLEQLDILGEEVVPVLRKEFDTLRPAHVPDGPTHAALVAERDAAELAGVDALEADDADAEPRARSEVK